MRERRKHNQISHQLICQSVYLFTPFFPNLNYKLTSKRSILLANTQREKMYLYVIGNGMDSFNEFCYGSEALEFYSLSFFMP